MHFPVHDTSTGLVFPLFLPPAMVAFFELMSKEFETSGKPIARSSTRV